MVEETGWFAWEYGHRTPRRAFRFALENQAPAVFLTAIVPYKGTNVPAVSAQLPAALQAGDDGVEFAVDALGTSWTIGRDVASGEAWIR